MQGMNWAGLKKHPSLIPLYVFVGIGFLGSIGYTLRLATRSPDVSWSKTGNLEPWQEYKNKQYKFYEPNRDYSKIDTGAPKF